MKTCNYVYKNLHTLQSETQKMDLRIRLNLGHMDALEWKVQ